MAETRNRKIHFININGTAESPVWTQINKGFTAFTGNLNPESESSQYIGEQNATESVKKYSASYAYTYRLETESNGSLNAVVQKFYDIAKNQELNKKFDILTVYLFDVDSVSGNPKAMRGTFNVVPEVDGDSEPGEYLEGSGTLNQEGSLVKGTFNVSTGVFTPDDAEESES